MTKTKERLTTPIGTAKWAHLNKPKPPYKGDKDKGAKYQIDVVFDPQDPEWKAWGSEMKARAKAAGGGVSIKAETVKDEQGNKVKTGKYQASFKTSEKFRPKVFDHDGAPMNPETLVGNGSKVRVNFTPAEYEGFGGGITFYLNAVQVVELVEYEPGDAAAYGFKVSEAVEAAHRTPDDDWEPAGPIPDDDLPF